MEFVWFLQGVVISIRNILEKQAWLKFWISTIKRDVPSNCEVKFLLKHGVMLGKQTFKSLSCPQDTACRGWGLEWEQGLTPRNWGVQCSHGRSCTSIALLLILKAGVKIQFSTQPIPGCVDIEMSTSQGKHFPLKPFKPLHKDACLTLYVGMQQSVFLLDVLEAFWHRYISLPNGKHVLCIC